MSLDVLMPKVHHWHLKSETIVFTNGCFDLIHYGHIKYLSDAADLGDRLIIGLNSDASVKNLKGAHRPIKDEMSRSHTLAALHFVDAILIFEEDSPLKLIQSISPNFLVKGGDWAVDQIVGSEHVINNNGEVLSIPFIDGYSTTNLEQKILDSHGHKG
ncbi:MAG: D-glycero-beta-D-manno-heptose 1-phosphate adenylyltransferase [Flavobacteriales bacterium]|nr:D-glycero-beta-D-manno-heptose 1-phosphate adenylyltransferase [Flavobacteriales bacterium]